MAGQSINDRITAAKYSLAGQGLAKAVCKATTEEVIGPKKKHLEYLLLCTNEANVSIPQLANLLIERTQMQSWVSVFKALITVHHLMCYGNERFTQFLASSNCNFNLGGFLDKSGTTGGGGQQQPQLSYDMSTFIRRYAKYINEKAISYRSVAFDFCKTKRSKEDGTLRVMSTDTLLKTLPTLQNQLDALLDFDCTASELNNGVINCAFMLLFRDLIRLYACYSDGVINLLEKYFEMNKKQAREALDCYKKFLIRMDRVAEFLKVAENVGIDKGELPDLKKAPSTLLDALESHLASLEGKKGVTPSAASNGRVGETANGGSGGSPPMDEITKRAALAEEEAMYEKLKQEHSKNNPFLSSPNGAGGESAAGAGAPSTTTPAVVDLFGGPQVEPSPSNQSKVSDDLLQLGNPFADILSTSGAAAPPPVMGVPAGSAPSAVFGVQQSQPQMPFTNGFMQPMSFVPDRSFEAVFGANYSNNNNNNNYNVHTAYTFDGFGEILKPEGKVAAGGPPGGGAVPHSAPQSSQKLITGDLDMSLSSLVENLNMKGPNQPKNQWSSPKSQNKTGGGGWTGSAQPPGASMGSYKQPSPIASGQWGGVNPQGASGMPQMGMMGSGFPGAQSGGVGAPPGSGPAPFDPLA